MRLIITADWHLRLDVPICRKETEEEWFQQQAEIISFICKQADSYKADLCIIGDIYHRAKSENRLVNLFLSEVYCRHQVIRMLAGNHDLPEHSWNNVDDSSYGSLFLSGKYGRLDEIGMANDFNSDFIGENEEIIFTHQPVIDDKAKLSRIKGAKTPQQMMDEFPKAKLICTGDGHSTIIYKKKDRLLINPGSITRQTADQKDHKPCIFYIDTEDFSTLKRIELLDHGEVSDEHRRKIEEKEERISAFVEKIAKTKNVSMDFEQNVREAIFETEMDSETEKTIHKLLNGEEI